LGGKPLQKAGHASKPIRRDAVGNDEHSVMGTAIIEKLHSEADEIIPVAGHHASALLGGKFQLLPIRCLQHPSLVGGYGIDTVFPEDFSDLRTEVFIQIELHERGLTKG